MTHEAVQKWLGTGKDALALSRDTVVVGLFGMLLITPAFVGQRLSAAGFEEGSLMGFKWKRKAEDFGKEILDLKKALELANGRLRTQTIQLQQSQQALVRLQATATTPQQARQIDRLLTANLKLSAQNMQARQQVTAKIASTQAVAQSARDVTGADRGWAVVMGADRNLDEASYEVKLAIARGMPGVTLYHRQGYFRTVALAPTKQAAEALLPQARARSLRAYVVRMDSWCPNRDIREGYTACLEL